MELELDNQKHLIKLHDTAGQEDYERIRQVIYKEVCFTGHTSCRRTNLTLAIAGKLFHSMLFPGQSGVVWKYSNQMVWRVEAVPQCANRAGR